MTEALISTVIILMIMGVIAFVVISTARESDRRSDQRRRVELSPEQERVEALKRIHHRRKE